MQRVNADRLIRDLSAVAEDVDELFKATAGNANEAIIDARERVRRSLQIAGLLLEVARLRAKEDARKAMRSMDDRLRPNAWKAVGIAAGVGLLFGAVVGVNAGSPRRRRSVMAYSPPHEARRGSASDSTRPESRRSRPPAP